MSGELNSEAFRIYKWELVQAFEVATKGFRQQLAEKLNNIEKGIQNMAISQAQFDTDLAALVAAITNLITAVNAKLASVPPSDLTAEDNSVQTAAAAVQAELTTLGGTVPPVTPPPAP